MKKANINYDYNPKLAPFTNAKISCVVFRLYIFKTLDANDPQVTSIFCNKNLSLNSLMVNALTTHS